MASPVRLAHGPALLALLFALGALLALSCGDDDATAPATGATASGDVREITFMAGFRAQANLPFVAVYVANAKGYFAEEGLQVDIEHSAGQDEHLKLLLSKEIEFTTGTAAQVLRRRADGLPLQAVALFGQRGDQGFVARADSGIETPADFRGRTVGFKAGVVPAELHGLLATAGLTEDDVELQAVGFDPRIFIEGGIDVFPVFLSNEPYAIRRAGVDINVFDPADYGVATLGLTFLAHEDTVRQDPDLVRRFLRASLRGAQYAAEHVDEAVSITLEYAPGADSGQQQFLLETDLANAQRADGLGRSSAEQWDGLQQTLLQAGVLTEPADARSAMNSSFVDSLYDPEGHLR